MKIQDIDFKTVDGELLTSSMFTREFCQDMSYEQAADILQKQVDMYHENCEHSSSHAIGPRNHTGRALELAVELLRRESQANKTPAVVYKTSNTSIPENCLECECEWCRVGTKRDGITIKAPYTKKRPKDCPLIEVEVKDGCE